VTKKFNFIASQLICCNLWRFYIGLRVWNKLFLIILFWNWNYFILFYQVKPKEQLVNQSDGEDSDVSFERHQLRQATNSADVFSSLLKDHSLVVVDLTKRYKGGLLAVDHLNVSVVPGDCFGLLGLNGAGKTSTFQMLTGDSIISSGEAWLDGYNIKTDIRQVITGNHCIILVSQKLIRLYHMDHRNWSD